MFDETSAPGLNSACTTDENGMFTAPKQSVATHSNTIKITNAIKPINKRRKRTSDYSKTTIEIFMWFNFIPLKLF
jgi:hypothetical protein